MKTPNEKRKLDDREGIRVAGMLLLLAADMGDGADVLQAMRAIDPFALAPLADKFGDPAAMMMNEQMTRLPGAPVVQKIPFPEFEAACFLHDADPKYCTCYKHKENANGRAICSETGCPLYCVKN